MVSMRMIGRVVPRVRVNAARPWNNKRNIAVPPMVPQPGYVRHFNRGPFWREPFTQMEEFMRDMERKFKRDIEDTMNTFARTFPASGREMSRAVGRPIQHGFGEMQNVSTPEKYKLNFYLFTAKPEDVKVTLKGRSLSVKGQAVVETENTKSSHEMNIELELPEDVEVDALESSFSQEGILVVEAPRNPAAGPEAPKAIPIQRE